MSDGLALFIRDQISRARKELNYEDALLYLRHLALLCEGEAEPLRGAVLTLTEGDRQLGLIASGQLRLDFHEPSAAAVAGRIPNTVGARVRHMREARGFTLERLAGLINYQHSTISNVENGHDRPGKKLIRALGHALHVEPAWLLHGPNNPTA